MTNKVTIINDGPYVIDVIRGGFDLIRLHPNAKFETYHWIGTDIVIKEAVPDLVIYTSADSVEDIEEFDDGA